MRIEKILKKIEEKKLKPLELSIFEVFQTYKETLKLSSGIPNDKILESLEKIYKDFAFQQELAYLKKLRQQQQQQKRQKNKKNSQLKPLEKERKAFFEKTKVIDLDFRESDTFFTPQFEKKIEETLKEKTFETLTKEEVDELNEQLQNISTIEFEWREYHRRIINQETTHEQFETEFTKFSESFTILKNPTVEELQGQRAGNKFAPFKIGLFAKALISYLYKNEQFRFLEFCITYTPEELGQLVVNYIENNRIFNDLSRISIKKAHEKLIYSQDTSKLKFTDDVLSINKLALVGDFEKGFAVEIFYAIINHGEDLKKIPTEVAEVLCREVQAAIFYKGLLINIESKYKKDYLSYIDLIYSIIEIFISSGFFANIINIKTEKSKTITQLVLRDKLIVEVLRPLKFPFIIRPTLIKKKDIDFLLKPLINGKADLTKTDYLVTALNISRTKQFKVNELFLTACEWFLEKNINQTNPLKNWLAEGNIDLGTVHISTIKKNDESFKSLKTTMYPTEISLRIANSISVQFSKLYNKHVKFSDILPHCGVTKTEKTAYYNIKHLEESLISDAIDWKYANSRLFLAKQLKTFPIYITDTLCIRLRKYPREHWLSRTAGEFKHLIQNFKTSKLTLKGFISLLKAYYQADPEMLDQFIHFTRNSKISKKNGMILLTEYFKKNPLNFTKLKKPMYFINLHLALIQSTSEDYQTAVNVEVDQNASALVILSLVLRSRKMAESSNVLGGSEKVSPYNFIKSKVTDYFEANRNDFETSEIKILENQDVYKFICESRNLHKYAIMCFCYNQTVLGRMKDFIAMWVEELGYVPNKRQKNFLNRFAVKYADFVEFVYPNTTRKLSILKELVDIVCEDASKISIKTLDGEIINWAFYATTVKKRKYYDTVNRMHKSYSINVLKERNKFLTEKNEETHENEIFPSNFQLDQRGMKRRFLSYLIHSIDASILRRIICKMKLEHKAHINHLHDCVILHPNDLETFYVVIKNIYSTPDIYNIIETGVFEQVATNLSPEGRKKLEILKKEFFSLCDNFITELPNINPEHMYSLED